MKKIGLYIWTIFLLATSILLSYFALRPITQTGTVINVSADAGDTIMVQGADTYHVVGSGVGYFRITSGRYTVSGDPITGNNFSGKGYLGGHEWFINDGDADYTITADDAIITATRYQSLSDWILIIFMATISFFLFYMLGYMFYDLS